MLSVRSDVCQKAVQKQIVSRERCHELDGKCDSRCPISGPFILQQWSAVQGP